MLMQSDVPSCSPLEHALRKYPSVVPHRLQKSVRSSGDKEFIYANSFDISPLYHSVQGRSSNIYHPVFYNTKGNTNPYTGQQGTQRDTTYDAFLPHKNPNDMSR